MRWFGERKSSLFGSDAAFPTERCNINFWRKKKWQKKKSFSLIQADLTQAALFHG